VTLNRAFVQRLQEDDESFLVDVGDLPVRDLGLDESAMAGYVPGHGRDDVDLTPFTEANKRGKLRTRADHVARAELVRQQFPSVAADRRRLKEIFDERPEVFRALLKVLVEVDANEELRPGKAGHRPAVGYADGERRLRRLFGKEYSMLPFGEAFKVLGRGRFLTSTAAKTGLTRTRVFRLQRQEVEPSAFDMEQVAKAFGVHPSYFIEWRTACVIAAIHDRMVGSPETSMNLYAKIMQS
jgi:transcriptional regulator with XRE-family HTH domain